MIPAVDLAFQENDNTYSSYAFSLLPIRRTL